MEPGNLCKFHAPSLPLAAHELLVFNWPHSRALNLNTQRSAFYINLMINSNGSGVAIQYIATVY